MVAVQQITPAFREIPHLIPDPILATATCFFWTGPQIAEVLDQGSVLAVHVFGFLSIYFTPQLEIDLVN